MAPVMFWLPVHAKQQCLIFVTVISAKKKQEHLVELASITI